MTGDVVRTVAPGGTIGMLGGGQLGRMTALAAAQLGYKTHVFSPDADSPCAQVSAAKPSPVTVIMKRLPASPARSMS